METLYEDLEEPEDEQEGTVGLLIIVYPN